MSNLTYWQKRFLQIKASQLTNTKDYELALQPQLNGLQHELDIELNRYYRRYSQTNDIPVEEVEKMLKDIGNSNWSMTLEVFKAKAIAGGYEKELDTEYFKSQISRLKILETQLKQHTASFGDKQADSLCDELVKQFDDSYMRTTYTTQLAKQNFTSNFAHFNEDQMKVIVSKPWSGANFSKRIWKNYREYIPDKLMDTLLRGTLLGYSTNKMTSMFHERFKEVKKANVHRLIVSELGHVTEEATATSYKESGVTEYSYMATLESHTCDICGHLDGRIFKTSERIEGENYPLIHAHCRCTTVPYLDDLPDMRLRWMRDPETGKGKIIENMSFDEWKRKYINVNDKAENKYLLPNVKDAIFPESKLTKYALDPTAIKSGGADKARVFQSSLGYNLGNYKDLISEVNKGIKLNRAVEQEDNGFGQRYKVDIPITGPNGNTRTVTTAWIEDKKTGQMKLTTIFVKSLKGDDKNE